MGKGARWGRGAEQYVKGKTTKNIGAITMSVFPGIGSTFVQILELANPKLGKVKVVLDTINM